MIKKSTADWCSSSMPNWYEIKASEQPTHKTYNKNLYTHNGHTHKGMKNINKKKIGAISSNLFHSKALEAWSAFITSTYVASETERDGRRSKFVLCVDSWNQSTFTVDCWQHINNSKHPVFVLFRYFLVVCLVFFFWECMSYKFLLHIHGG